MHNDERYAQSMGRMNKVSTFAAAAIMLLTAVAVYPNHRNLLIVICINSGLLGFNTWVTLWLLPRRGPLFAETLRTAVNLICTIALGILTGWPLPLWLWLPYIGVAFDHFRPGFPIKMLLAFGGTESVIAIAMGVSPGIPASFMALAVICSEISRVRFETIRRMVTESDVQRRELEEGNRALELSHQDLQREIQTRERAEMELRHAQKLEAVGRLAAGVAHEINTPIQFVGDSLRFIQDAMSDLSSFAAAQEQLRAAVQQGKPAVEAAGAAAKAAEDADIEYLLENVPSAITRALDGLERVASIVRSMQKFAHPDQSHKAQVQLNDSIASTLVMAASEVKFVADVETDYGDLPPVTCFGGEINQVLLNVIVNAAHAVSAVVDETHERGLIRVRTRCEGDEVVLRISDSGPGIPATIRDRVFEPFFTTKAIGKGTGQGLAISRSIVVEKHGGRLDFESEVGKGTTFIIRLPVAGKTQAASFRAAA